MRIEVESLRERAEAFSHSYAPGEVELEDEGSRLVAPAEVSGEASLKGEEVRVRGTINTDVELLCDRCAAPLRAPLEVEFDARFVPQSKAAGETDNVELLAEDLGVAAYEGDSVDLDELVREQILLALPSRNLCREDCKGLCQKCGANLNAGECSCAQSETDPRWAALADWKKNTG
jgi:uncharacterized protein